MSKTFGIKEKDFYTFIKKLNEFSEKNNVFATQTHLDNNDLTWYAIIYYEPFNKQEKKIDFAKQVHKSTSSTSLATQPQKNLLKKLDWKGNYDTLTKQEAFKLLDSKIGRGDKR